MVKRLADQSYYHGIRTREEIEKELKKPGDFLVRASQTSTRTEIVLSVLGENGLSDIVLSIVGDAPPKYCLHSQKTAPNRTEFDSVVDLINFYKDSPLPGGVKLKRGIPRPAWFIRHSAIQFNEVTDKLGSGNYCDVYKGKFVDLWGRSIIAAIKVCHQEAQTSLQEQQETRASMLREAKIMSRVNHPNVIRFFGVACDYSPILLVMEFCPGKSLEDQLRQFPHISLYELTLYCFEVTRGMRYLHQQHCIHRDLATRNCLISAAGIIKISDFGLSKIMSELQNGEQKISHVPIRWMAPECLTKKPVYSKSSDVWAFGVLIYEVFNQGVAPWPEDKDFKAMAKRIRAYEMPAFPKHTPDFMQKMVLERIWQPTDTRVSFKDILVILADYVFEQVPNFPPVADLFLNKIDGVKRKAIFFGSKKEMLADDKVVPTSPKGNSRIFKKRRISHKTKKTDKSGSSYSLRKKDVSVEDTRVSRHGLSAGNTQKSSTTVNENS